LSASSAAGTRKRAHKTLTIDQKLELLDQIGKTSYTMLCEKYRIGRSTITLTIQAQDDRYGSEAAGQDDEAWEG